MRNLIVIYLFALAISAMPFGITASANEHGGHEGGHMGGGEHHGGGHEGGWHPGGGHMGGGWHWGRGRMAWRRWLSPSPWRRLARRSVVANMLGIWRVGV